MSELTPIKNQITPINTAQQNDELTRLTTGDFLLILLQLLFGSTILAAIPGEGLNLWGISCAAYLLLVLIAICHALRRGGLRRNDRAVLLMGFLPLSIISVIIIVVVWSIKY